MFLRLLTALILSVFTLSSHAFDETKFAEALGLDLISNGNPFNFLGVNRMYANEDLSRQLLIAADVPATLKEMRVIKRKGFFILEIPKSESSYWSMAIVGIPEEDAMKLIEEKKTTSIIRTIINELMPIRSAYSTECAIPGSHASLSSLDGLKEFYGSSVAQGALKCMSSALQGAWDSTGGMVVSAYEGFKELIKSPGEWWDKKVEQVKNLKNFITHFDTKIKEMGVAIANMPAETKVQLICGFVGGLGADIALALLTGGAGAAKVMLRMEEYVSKVMRLEKVFALFSRLGKLKELPMNFWERMSAGRIPDSVINTMSTFAHHEFPDLVKGALSCAL